jgi:ADP-ribose pyrophosphatase YjhB (NUDIX family)
MNALSSAIRFCSRCGHGVTLRVPPGDHLPRHVCDACGTVHYENPKMVVGCIAEWDDARILLCRRAIEPRRGLWTVPAGFMENGETSAQGAARETLEEANARVEVIGLYALYDIPYIHQAYLLFRARLLDLDFHPGEESLETVLVAEADIPWDTLAFATVRRTLQRYFADRAHGEYRFHTGVIEPTPGVAPPVTAR